MKLVKEFINEEHLSYVDNFKKYKEILIKYPYLKNILEDILYCNVNHQIYQIKEDNDSLSIWFNASGSLSLYFNNSEKSKLLEKYRVSIQFPGNQEYGFSVSIDLK